MGWRGDQAREDAEARKRRRQPWRQRVSLRRQATFWLGVALLLATLFARPSDAATQDEQLGTLDKVAALAYIDCMRGQARDLDDGISDARSIAQGIVAACSAARRRLAVGSSRGNFQVQVELQRAFDARAESEATRAVLNQRRKSRSR